MLLHDDPSTSVRQQTAATLLSNLKESVQAVQQQAAEGADFVDGSFVVGIDRGQRLVDAVEAVLSYGRRDQVAVWDWVRHLENSEQEWAVQGVAQIKSQPVRDSRNRELGRRWIRYSLNQATLSASVALLLEMGPQVSGAFYEDWAIMASRDRSQDVLRILMPIGGPDLDLRRNNVPHGQSFFTFRQNISHPEDETLPELNQTARPCVGPLEVTNTRPKDRRTSKRRTGSRTPRHEKPSRASPSAALSRSFDPSALRGSSDGGLSTPSLPDPTGSAPAPELRISSVTMQSALTDQADEEPQHSSPGGSLPDEATSPEGTQSEAGPELTPSASPVECYHEVRCALRNKQAILTRGEVSAEALDAYAMHLRSVQDYAVAAIARAEALEAAAAKEMATAKEITKAAFTSLTAAPQLAEVKEPEERSTGNLLPEEGGRFSICHTQTMLRVTISDDKLVLSRLMIPAAFRFKEVATSKGPATYIVHTETGRVLVPGGFLGWDASLQLVAENAVGGKRASWALDASGYLTEVISGKCVHPAGGTAKDGVNLVLHESREDGERLQYRLEPLGEVSEVCGAAVDDFDEEIPTVQPGPAFDPSILLSALPSEAFSAPQSASERAPASEPPKAAEAEDTPWASSDQSSARHRMKLILEVHEKHADYAEKEQRIEQQHKKCQGCMRDLKKSYSPAYFQYRYDLVRFCWYTGGYYCAGCHDKSAEIPIPARVVQNWDVIPRPVCRDAFIYLSNLSDKPVVCVSARNPHLFDQVAVLASARETRLQLGILSEIVKKCPNFTHQMKENPKLLGDTKAYHMEETELYSMNDLLSFHKSQPLNAAPVVACPVLRGLNTTKELLVRHVKRSCPQHCSVTGRVCEGCTLGPTASAEPLFAFELSKVQICRKCNRIYHKECYQQRQCAACKGLRA